MDKREDIIAGTCRSLVRASGRLRKDLERVLNASGLSGPQFGILIQLDNHGSMPLSELGKRLWVSCGNVTGLVDKLDASGHVRRIRQDSDRRVIFAELTEKGREVMRELRPLHASCMADFCSTLEEDELLQLQALLEKMYRPVQVESCCSSEVGGE